MDLSQIFTRTFLFLTHFDLSSNNLTGTLPEGIQNLISLQYFDISGNPFMRDENDATSNAYQPDFSKMARPPEADNFTCPEGRLTFNNGLIRLDPTFYEYKYCICDTGFYGDKGMCKQCMKDGTCQRWAPSSVEDLRPSIMNISSGYWPSLMLLTPHILSNVLLNPPAIHQVYVAVDWSHRQKTLVRPSRDLQCHL